MLTHIWRALLMALYLRDAGDPVVPDAATPPPAATEPPEDPFDKDRAMATIKALREKEKAGKATDKALADALAKLKAIEDAQLSAQEKAEKALAEATKRADDLQAKLSQAEQERRTHRLTRAVEQAGLVVDAEVALHLLNPAELLDEDGQPKAASIKGALEKLIAAKPYLAVKQGGSGGVPASPRAASNAQNMEAEKERARQQFAREIRFF